MSTDIEKRARETIKLIIVKLDDGLIKSKFDEPISRITRGFQYEVKQHIDHKTFHRIIADFIQQIYDKGLKSSLMLADPLAEAISLLENHYQSATYGNGYAAAVLDANDADEGGIQTVLTSLAELIKDIERQKYISALFAYHLPGCDWDLLCEIARILLQDYGPFMPERLARCVPAQIAGQIQSIILGYIGSDSVLQQISFFSEKPSTAEIRFNRQLL